MININPVINKSNNYKCSFSAQNEHVTDSHEKLASDEKSTSAKKDVYDKKNIAVVSSVVSVGAIILTLAAIAKGKAKKAGKPVKMFNMHLNEGDIFKLGAATVAGAAAGGILVDDKKYKMSKIREASHQIIGNIATPLACIWALNKGMDKLKIKMPKIKGGSKLTKCANFGLEILPNLISSCAGLYLGINAGNVISNKINDGIFGKKAVKREVKIEDYCIHIDDPLTVLTLADKSGKIKSFTGKVMPFVFILSGYQAGTARE